MNPKNLELIKMFIGKEFTASPSPFMRWLNPTIVSAEYGKIEMQYLIREEMTNPTGLLHGGVSAAIIDDIIGATMYSINDESNVFYTTVNNSIDYLASLKKGDFIIAETELVKKGRIANVKCRLWNEDRTKLLAQATSNLLKISQKK